MNHSHILYDSDPHFKIDPISRKITKEPSSKTNLIQHDHNSERFTFEMPRYIEGHDMSLSNIVEIHYLNFENNGKNVKAGVYSVDDLQVKEDDENTVVCSWLVSNNATQLVGQLQFLVRFSCVSDTTGEVEYVWNTAIYNSINISNGIYNSESGSDNPVPPFNFVTTIGGQVLKFFVGTKAEYDALTFEQKENLFAILTDEHTKEEFFQRMDEIETDVSSLETDMTTVKTDVNDILSGDTIVPEATHAVRADYAQAMDGVVKRRLITDTQRTLTTSSVNGGTTLFSKEINTEGWYVEIETNAFGIHRVYLSASGVGARIAITHYITLVITANYETMGTEYRYRFAAYYERASGDIPSNAVPIINKIYELI